MNPLQSLFSNLSGSEEAPKKSPTAIPAETLARAISDLDAKPFAPSPAGSFSGAGFQDILLNVADAKFTKGAEQRYPIQGYGLHLSKDGTAPDVSLVVNAGRGPVRLSPGEGFRGKFDGFTLKLFNNQRRIITRHDARLVVELDQDARFIENQTLARFRPVPLLSGDRLLSEAGTVILSTGSSGDFYPQGFEKIQVEMVASANNFGASEQFDFYLTTRPAAQGVSAVTWKLDGYSKTVNANGTTGLVFVADVPPLGNDSNDLVFAPGTGISARNAIDMRWTASGLAVAAQVWITGVK